MAAYAAVVSLMHIINNIENHPSPPISLDKHQVESLIEKLAVLEEFLENYDSPFAYSNKADPFEIRIADATHAVEDVIESYIVDTIHLYAATGDDDGGGGQEISGIHFYQDLQKVIEEMDLIKKDAMEITWEKGKQQRSIASDDARSRSSFTEKNSRMVGFEDVFLQLVEKLTDDRTNRRIIPIVGMGGIGKTTLAKGAFEHKRIRQHFDFCIWTTISHTYNVREILREVFLQATGGSGSDLSKDKNKLGAKLYQYLFGRRYLIIMDDMWSIEVWDKIRNFLPDNENGSRIIVTTRLSNLGSQLNESSQIDMKFLDEASVWFLFCKTVFGEESCPLELENIGKNIVANCKGLPISIATVGGLLANSERTRECWECVEQNLNSIVLNSNDEFCLKILRMSYIYLPNHLKPCFLYMGAFEEDRSIRVSMLKKLWVSEGFLKPTSGKCLETIAQEYLMELVQRNLIFVYELGSTGNVKYCKIHNLLRELCLKEVENEGFYHVIRDYTPFNNSERRVVFPVKTRGLLTSEVVGSLSHARSIICDNGGSEEGGGEIRLPNNLRLLKTFKAYDDSTTPWNDAYFLDNVFGLVNSCYLAVNVHRKSKFPASIGLLWNIQTLIIYCRHDLNAPIEIWKLHQLRHLVFVVGGVILPDPPNDDNDIVIMENLQTLKGVKILILNEEVVKRIPNVKKLDLSYNVKQMEGENCLAYLHCLSKLENFSCSTKYGSNECWQWIRFPHSLRKLVVDVTPYQEVEDILQKIGSLPLLEKFVLKRGLFKTGKWETIEDNFLRLKSLHLEKCLGLENWIVQDSSHFPCLEKLYLSFVGKLKKIPSDIGEISTLQSISLVYCSKSAVMSAKVIAEEREDLYGESLHVRALVRKNQEALKSLATANFEVEVCSLGK